MDRKKYIDRFYIKLILKNIKLLKFYLNILNFNEVKVVNFLFIC